MSSTVYLVLVAYDILGKQTISKSDGQTIRAILEMVEKLVISLHIALKTILR